MSLLDDPELLRLLERYFSAALLVLLRVGPIVLLTPVFGGQGTPRRLRMGLALLLASGLAPIALRFDLSFQPVEAGLVLLGEALVGLTLAVFVRIAFEMIGVIGTLIDGARGALQAELLDPLSRTGSSPVALLVSQFGLVVFFSLGGYRVLLDAVERSYQSAPPGSLIAASTFIGPAASARLVALTADLFVYGASLAAPVIVVLLVVDVALALVNRVTSQVQVFFLGMTMKGMAGLLVALLTLGTAFDVVIRDVMRAMIAFFSGE